MDTRSFLIYFIIALFVLALAVLLIWLLNTLFNTKLEYSPKNIIAACVVTFLAVLLV